MREQTPPQLLEAAQSRVSSARDLLARPRTCNMDECVKYLWEAQSYLERLRDNLREAGPAGRELRDPLIALGREIRQAGALLEQAARFGRRWLERLRATSSSYTAAGSPAPSPVRGRISILG
jgi:hypothetical protein